MTNKVSLLLCMFFLLQFVLFCGDIISYQFMLSKVYMVTAYVNDYISGKGEIDAYIEEYVINELGVTIEHDDIGKVSSGYTLKYSISIKYDPIFNLLDSYCSDSKLTQMVYVR